MIQAESLRIGNLIYNPNKEVKRVLSITSRKINFEYHRGDNSSFELPTWIDTCIPIPLTEEWLIKFGFQRNVGWDDMVYWTAGKPYTAYTLWDTLQGYENGNDRIIQYVHTLQNAFFFDQLEELTLNP